LTEHRKTSGGIIDELSVNSRRLAVGHAILGAAAAFGFLSRPDILHPSLRVMTGYRAGSIDVIGHALVAWVPYLISWLISREALSGRDRSAAIVFLGIATGITAASILINFPAGGAISSSALLFSGALTAALVAACGVCALLWRRDA
jgi:hypothetical protein